MTTIGTQRFFSIIILAFCFLSISFGGKADRSTEWSIVSGIMGYWLPTPGGER